MKNKTIIVAIGLLICLNLNAQEETEGIGSGFAFGFQLTEHQQDYGVGLNISSPYFAGDAMCIRLKGNLVWNQHLNSENITVWTPYSNFSLGFVGVAGKIGEFIRLYGEGGVKLILPADDFSGEDFVLGGYGLFGFEFFTNKYSNYFIELGGIGTGAVKDKIAGKPIYSNGMLINAGFRYQL